MMIRKWGIFLLTLFTLLSLTGCESLTKGTVYDKNSSVNYAIKHDPNPNAKGITYSVGDQLEQDKNSPYELYYSGLGYGGDVIITVIEKNTGTSIQLDFDDGFVIKTSKKGRFGFKEEYRIVELIDGGKVNLKRIH